MAADFPPVFEVVFLCKLCLTRLSLELVLRVPPVFYLCWAFVLEFFYVAYWFINLSWLPNIEFVYKFYLLTFFSFLCCGVGTPEFPDMLMGGAF